jgi:hypothetical protein
MLSGVKTEIIYQGSLTYQDESQNEEQQWVRHAVQTERARQEGRVNGHHPG